MLDTLQKAKNDLQQGWRTPDGAICQCCGQKVKLYKRKLNSGQAWALIQLARISQQKQEIYHHYNDITGDRNITDFAQLRHWELIKPGRNDNPEKAASGEWCITEKGRDFVENKIVVPTYMETFNKRVRGVSETDTNIINALGNHFEYPELMGWLI